MKFVLKPEERAELEQIDPDHLRRIDEGWSWIELWGGPYDGRRCYHIGPPPWQHRMLDPGVDVKDYIEGVHPIHVYELCPFVRQDGEVRSVYRHVLVTTKRGV